MKPVLIACDFDGTVTRQDTLVELLNRFGSANWTEIQERVVSGELSIREGLTEEMRSVRAGAEEVDQLLSSRVEMDPSFPPFLQKTRRKGIPLVILSGGFDLCVRTVFQQAGLWPVPLLANQIRPDEGFWQVDFPHPSARCTACGLCKGDSIRKWNSQGYTTVFVGNGVTDRCAAQVAQMTFAKSELGSWCDDRRIPAVRYETFDDIQQELARREWL